MWRPFVQLDWISNGRIRKLAHDRVTFCYQDSNTGETRTCTLSAQEFIRRFMQHVLPKGFVKVRYYGIFSPGKRRLLPKLRRRLGGFNLAKLSNEHIVPMLLRGARLNHLELRCPVCGQVMQWVETLKPNGRHPP